jgi:hypothetical protein
MRWRRDEEVYRLRARRDENNARTADVAANDGVDDIAMPFQPFSIVATPPGCATAEVGLDRSVPRSPK